MILKKGRSLFYRLLYLLYRVNDKQIIHENPLCLAGHDCLSVDQEKECVDERRPLGRMAAVLSKDEDKH